MFYKIVFKEQYFIEHYAENSDHNVWKFILVVSNMKLSEVFNFLIFVFSYFCLFIFILYNTVVIVTIQ